MVIAARLGHAGHRRSARSVRDVRDVRDVIRRGDRARQRGPKATLRDSCSSNGSTPLGTGRRSGRHMMAAMRGASDENTPSFLIESEDVVYNRYMTVFNRRVVFPTRQGASASTRTNRGAREQEVHEFDVVGHPNANFHFCITFPYHPPADSGLHWTEGSVTLIKEYAQGPNALMYGLPAGSYHVDTHQSLEGCARAELSEEAHLCGGEMHQLLDERTCPKGIAEVKWCANRFTPFIVVDPEKDESPGHRDQEEFIQVQRVSINRLKGLLRSGEMMLPSITTAYWAFDWLEERYGKAKK